MLSSLPGLALRTAKLPGGVRVLGNPRRAQDSTVLVISMLSTLSHGSVFEPHLATITMCQSPRFQLSIVSARILVLHKSHVIAQHA